MIKQILVLLLITLSIEAHAQKDDNCKDYSIGYYKYPDLKFKDFIIYRTKDYQIEYNVKTKEWLILKMDWANSCEYSFTYLDTNMPGSKPYIGTTIIVKIMSSYSKGYDFDLYKPTEPERFMSGKIKLADDTIRKKNKRIVEKMIAKQIQADK